MADISAPPRPSWCDEEEEVSERGNLGERTGNSRKRGKDRQNDVSYFSLCLFWLTDFVNL